MLTILALSICICELSTSHIVILLRLNTSMHVIAWWRNLSISEMNLLPSTISWILLPAPVLLTRIVLMTGLTELSIIVGSVGGARVSIPSLEMTGFSSRLARLLSVLLVHTVSSQFLWHVVRAR